MKNAISVKNLSKSYRVYHDRNTTLKERILFNRTRYSDHVVLQNIDFEVGWGKTIGLVGRNGCGKSTLLKLLTGIIFPDQGDIFIHGKVSSLLELGAGFHPEYSGMENIFNNAAVFGLSRTEIDERVESIIEFSELQEYIDNPIRTYSSGMYMRLAFAVAISVDAQILLFDEILSVGDSSFQAKCFKKVRELKEAGKTIVIVSHSAGTIKEFCDEAVWLHHGKVACSGDPALVLEQYESIQ
jgi:ABC-2 type transport system ATP-binding protein